MGRNKNIGMFEMLMELPWWVGVISAGVVYVGFGLVMPAMLSGNPMGGMIAALCPTLAKWFAIFCLIAAVFSAIRSWSSRKLLDNQKSLDSIRSLDWQQFERLVGEAFRRQGYSVEETGGGGADGGVDLMLRKGSEKTVVQCKRWRERQVGVAIVRELYGVMVAEGAVCGIVVSSGTYSSDAQAFAAGKSMTLMDGSALADLVSTVQAGTRRASSPVPVSQSKPACPICSQPMVLRTAKKGNRAGNQFWGCSKYPTCRGIQNLP